MIASLLIAVGGSSGKNGAGVARRDSKKSSDRADFSHSTSHRFSARRIGWLVVAVVAVLFVVLNNNTTEINLVAASPEWPLWVLVVTSMALGFLLAKLTGRKEKGE